MEIWADIPEWEGKYQISNYGRFKSIGGRSKKLNPDGEITYGAKDIFGYRVATLRRPPKTRMMIRIHTLVGNAFVLKKESKLKLCINHKDGNKSNNHFENLEWITSAENIKHAVDTGLFNIKGENHPSVKLTKEKVIQMRELRKKGLTHQAIADMFGICRRQAGDVIKGINWGWLQDGL